MKYYKIIMVDINDRVRNIFDLLYVNGKTKLYQDKVRTLPAEDYEVLKSI